MSAETPSLKTLKISDPRTFEEGPAWDLLVAAFSNIKSLEDLDINGVDARDGNLNTQIAGVSRTVC
jgi:hypothetical protein